MAALTDSASLVAAGKQSIQPEYLSSTPSANLSPLCDWSRFPKLKWSAVMMSPNFVGFGNGMDLGSSPFLLCVCLCFCFEARLTSEMLREMCKVMGCRRFLNYFGRGYFRKLLGVAFNPFLRELKLGLFHLRLRQQCIFESPIEVYACTPMVADFLRIWLRGTSHELFDAFCIAAFVWLSQRLRRPCRRRHRGTR